MSTQTDAKIALELYRHAVSSLMEPLIASLEQIAQGTKVEVVHDRDPDSSCGISVFVDGRRADHSEYSCDAGAGYDWTDWVDSMASSIATASEPIAEMLRESAVSPSGSAYIENMPDDEAERCRQLDELIAKYKGVPPPGMQTWTFYGHWLDDELIIDHASIGSHDDVYPDGGVWEQGPFADSGTGYTIEEAEGEVRARYEDNDDDDEDTATSNAFVFIQQGGASNEYYVHPHDSAASAKRHQKSCRKASYVASEIYEVRGDTDFDAMQERADKTLGRNDWRGVHRLLAEAAV